MEDPKVVIAKRAARFLKDGDVVNLGIGMPEMVANYLPEGVNVVFHSENGIIGMSEAAENHNHSNAGGKYVTVIPGAMFFDSATSFGLIRGGHVNVAILGALQVDEEGSLSSHIIPGKMVPGMGGAMDLVSGSDNVIVITTHTDKKGNPLIYMGEVVWKTERDSARASRHMIVEALQFPDLKDKQLMEYYGCVDITEMPLKVFPKADEYQHVSRMVMQALGLAAPANDGEDIEDAKN